MTTLLRQLAAEPAHHVVQHPPQWFARTEEFACLCPAPFFSEEHTVESGATIYNAGPTFTIKANRSWTLKIKTTATPNWTYVGSDAGAKPISDLTWSSAAAGTYAAISTTDATLASGASSTNGGAAAVHFKTLWTNDFTAASNAPGTYSLPIVFTLTAP